MTFSQPTAAIDQPNAERPTRRPRRPSASRASNTPDRLVLGALEKALRAGGEVRLVTLGRKPDNVGLFPNDTKADCKAAIQQCRDLGLFKVERTETVKSGSKVKHHQFVTITPDGVRHLASRWPAETTAELLPKCLEEARARGADLRGRLDALIMAQDRTLGNLEALLGAFVQEAGTLRKQIEAEFQRVEARAVLLQSLCGEGEKVPEPSPPPPVAPQPVTQDEYRYQRQLAQQMVLALEEVRGTGADEPVERALFNAGVRHIGSAGENVPFNSSLHEADEPVAPRDQVTIIEPGWVVLDDGGEFTLAKAKVRPAPPEVTQDLAQR